VQARGGEVLQEVRERDGGEKVLYALWKHLLVCMSLGVGNARRRRQREIRGDDRKDTPAMIAHPQRLLVVVQPSPSPRPSVPRPCLSIPFSSVSRVEDLSRVSSRVG
jgi:hypothetical protein